MLGSRLAAAVLSVPAAACSDGRGGFGDPPAPATTTVAAPTSPATTRSPRTVVVETPGFSYEPDVVVLGRGEPILLELRNPDSRTHTLTIADLSLEMRAEPGETVRLPVAVPDEPGRLVMFCTVPGHRAAGHEGSVRIG